MIKKSRQQGFTLVEMVVAIAIFITVAVVAVGALLKIVDANKKAQGMKTAMTNMNFALESMSREMRVGTNFYCIAGEWNGTELTSKRACTESGSWTIAFKSSVAGTDRIAPVEKCNLIYSYYFDKDNSVLYKRQQRQYCDENPEYFPVVYGASESGLANDLSVKFETGTIKVVTGTNRQPYIQLKFSGYVGEKEKLKSEFNLQTTISQRLPD